MNYNDLKVSEVDRLITKYILMGYSRSKIAKIMTFSYSGLSYRLNLLFSKYNAKTRQEFIVNIFANILKDKNLELDNKTKVIFAIKSEINVLKGLIEKFVQNCENKDKLNFLILKIKACLEKITTY